MTMQTMSIMTMMVAMLISTVMAARMSIMVTKIMIVMATMMTLLPRPLHTTLCDARLLMTNFVHFFARCGTITNEITRAF